MAPPTEIRSIHHRHAPLMKRVIQNVVQGATPMDYKLELVPLPVADVDRAKAYYTEQLGFRLDHDIQ